MYAIVIQPLREATRGGEEGVPDLIVAESLQQVRRGAVRALCDRTSVGRSLLTQDMWDTHPESGDSDEVVVAWLHRVERAVPSLRITLYVLNANGTFGIGEPIPLDT